MFHKKKKKNSKYRRKIILAVVLFIVATFFICLATLVAIWSGFSFPDFHPMSKGDRDLVQIEDRLKISLPDSAKNIYGYYHSGYGYVFRIRFELPVNEFAVFLDQISHLCPDKPLEENVMPFADDNENSFWQPEEAKVFVGLECFGNDYYWDIMIDQADNEIWTIYIGGGAG